MATQEKIEALKKRKAQIDKQIAAAEARLKTKERKEDTRLKVLIGAAMLADSKINPQTIGLIETVLSRAITEKRDQDFLKAKGWLKTDAGQ
jgi:hypothetical protein